MKWTVLLVQWVFPQLHLTHGTHCQPEAVMKYIYTRHLFAHVFTLFTVSFKMVLYCTSKHTQPNIK